jgi:hypothetical protein
LTAFTFLQDMAPDVAKQTLTREELQPLIRTFVFSRVNDTYGICHTWPIKYNAQYQKDFHCTTDAEQVDTSVFHPQATHEFGETMKTLFGADALERAPLIFAESRRVNKRRAFVGTPHELMRYLRAHPEVCDELKIAKLYPGGFVAIYTCPGSVSGYKNFDFQPGVPQVIYTKEGWETMASIKPLELFNKDCTFLPDTSEMRASEGSRGRSNSEPSVKPPTGRPSDFNA